MTYNSSAFLGYISSPLRVGLVLMLRKVYHFIFIISSEMIQDCLLLFLSGVLSGLCLRSWRVAEWPSCSDPTTEMYPKCVIVSWDTLILLLDAENIEWRVQLDAEKKNRMFVQTTNSRKKQRHRMRKFVFHENNFYQLVDSSVTVYFAVKFQTKAEKPLCFLITFLSR